MTAANRVLASVAAAVIAAFALGYLAATVVGERNLPTCPTEDSCSLAYVDGRWYVGSVRVSR